MGGVEREQAVEAAFQVGLVGFQSGVLEIALSSPDRAGSLDQALQAGAEDRVSFGEDRSRIRTNPGVFARLRPFPFNILKTNPNGMLSQDRYRAALADIDRLIDIISPKR